jgi:hypothetical protein
LAVVRLRHTLTKFVQNLAAQLELLPSMESVLAVNGVTPGDLKQLRQMSANSAPVVIASRTDSKQPSESETAAW